jgi:hypothetical protein
MDGYSSIDALILWHNTRQSVRNYIQQQQNGGSNGYAKILRPPEIRQGGLEARRERDASEEKRNAQIRQEWKDREKPEAGDRNRSVRSAQEGRKGPAKTRRTKELGRKKTVESLKGQY